MKLQGTTLTLAFCILLVCASTVQAARAPLLRYQPRAAQTNVYNVQISVRGETGTDLLAGNLIVTTKPEGSGGVRLALQGTLIPKRDIPARPPMMGTPYSYPRWTTPVRIAESEIQFDERGRLLKVSGDSPLPVPLGTVAQLFVESLPEKAGSRWETTAELAVIGEPLTLGPATGFLSAPGMYPSYGYSSYPGVRGGLTIVSVTSRTKYEITANRSDRITIAKRVAVESPLRAGQEPQILATGEGQFEIEPTTGLLLSSILESTGTINSESVTRRTTTSLQVKRLEGAEREAVLNPPAQQVASGSTAKPLSETDLAKLFEDLQSDNTSVRHAAAVKLQAAKIETLPSGLLEFLSDKVTDTDSMLKNLAMKIIADHGTKEYVPTLLRLLKSDSYSDRQTAMRGLGRLRDASAAEPIADLLATGDMDTSAASEALIKIGPDAEDAVLALLKEKHTETRRNACRVLKQIGSEKSLEPLQALMLSPNRAVNEAAGEAARAIVARQDP